MPSSPFPVSPMNGPLDTRSPPGLVPFGSWRWKQNFLNRFGNPLCRAYGWQKLLGEVTSYQNQDHHDQLCIDGAAVSNIQTYYAETSPVTPDSAIVTEYPSSSCSATQSKRTTGRQPFTMLMEAVGTDGITRRVIAGTQNRITMLLPSEGNWRILSDAYGGTPQTGLPELRWKSAQVNDAVLFTNGVDPVLYHLLDQPIQGCGQQAAVPVPSLDLIALTAAATIFAWKGFVFLGDVVMEGIPVPHRLVWSDINKPVNFDPTTDSLAGFQDLSAGERILRCLDSGDYLYVFTNRSIWQVTYIGGAQVFSFYRKFSQPQTGDSCLAFPNTLRAVASGMIYLGQDAIYQWDQYSTEPKRLDWIHRASGTMFNTLDTSRCEAHVGHYHSPSQEYIVSWCERGQVFPQWTFHISMDPDNPGCWYEDIGFTAFLSTTIDQRPSTGQFLVENCICSQAELAAIPDAIQPVLKTGTNCSSTSGASCNVNTSGPFWTTATLDLGDGTLIEDWFQETPSPGGFCDYLSSLDIESLCSDCDQAPILVGAAAGDWCLKQNVAVTYRERCTSFNRCGTYVRDGYDSILRTGPIRGKTETEEIRIERLEVLYLADAQLVPNDLFMRVGWSATPDDPNSPTCTLRWKQLSAKALDCQSSNTPPLERPFKPLSWQMLFDSQVLYLEMKISGTGGGCCFTSFTPYFDGKILQNFV